ncbi:MAG: aldehyde dehydrogenase [Candidatus Heteroscillospira sp.]|jgi:aldehyde dehydrogenase (NAD+)
MEKTQIEALVRSQREYFRSGATLPVEARLTALRRLKSAVETNLDALALALEADLGKSAAESYMCETGMLLSELSHMLRHLRGYAREKTVMTPLAQFAARSYTRPTPYGNVLIMSPWNYPLLLSLGPLADAIAAGNTAVLKPSAYSPNTSRALEKLISETFPSGLAAVVTGGREENLGLLETKFDYIFFTGGTKTARTVLEHAARYITPVTLELGGKSPCVVTDSAKIDLAARRIVFDKFLNCGQTCVAPDFVFCRRGIRDELLEAIKREIKRQYGDGGCGKIINRRHFERLSALLGDGEVVFGGKTDPEKLRIEPTVILEPSMDSTLMTEEIFGPILPIVCWDDIGEVFDFMESRPKPLAFYVFSENRREIKSLMDTCRFGGGCVNDTVIHLATSAMGFGGVGESGMGAYHGRAGFEAFSHSKSIVDKKTWLDLPMRYRPYTKTAEKLIRTFMR